MHVCRLALPDVLFAREVNVFLVKDDPITLIDTGPNTKDALDVLTRKLNKEGLSIEDIERVIITHSHPDHCGLLGEIQLASGAKVFVPNAIKAWIENYLVEWNVETLKIMKLLADYNVPRAYISAIMATARGRRKLATAAHVDAALVGGDLVEFSGFEFEVIHTPGHSHWCISLFEQKTRALFCGDLVIENVPIHPFMQPTAQAPEEWPNQIEMFQGSLATVRSHFPKLIYPGHGNPFTNPDDVIDKILQTFEEKQERILEIIKTGKTDLFQIGQRLNTSKTAPEQLVGLFETLNHLKRLTARGLVTEKDSSFSLS